MIPPPLPVEEQPRPPVSAGLVGMFNAFVDPAATARAALAPLSWLWPLIITSIAASLLAVFSGPLRVNVLRMNPPPGATPEKMESVIHFTEIVSKVVPFVMPLLIAGFTALFAALVLLAASMSGIRAKFRDIFSLMCLCSLINAVQIVASYFVLRAKADEIQSAQQLQPSFGLDIFFPNVKGPFYAFLNYFSLFQVWYLIMLGLALAHLTRSSKGKAFFAITPAWLIPLILAIIGSLFQRSA
jgi:hypothetical protein